MAEKQLVVFRLGNEYYGVDILVVEGIIKMQDITKVPHAPQFVEGLTNLRGQVLPVLDLRKRFEMANMEDTDETRIITVQIGDIQAGMIVDAVSEVMSVDDEAIEKVSNMVTTKASEFIEGIAKVDNRLVILVDLSKVLSAEEESLLQEAVPVA